MVHNIPASTIDLAHISTRISKLPYLSVDKNFTDQSVIIHDCVVAVGQVRFLISAHYNPMGPVNAALKKLAPGFDWRGELIIVALGEKVPYLSRMNSRLAAAALNNHLSLETNKTPR
ncbi:hypothetical protein DFH09DRAFT_1088576 [Mycena vulgaris]|nr:hypothetical protein DFH09DRAFT_1088576 [Mycena vulgaris]